MYIHNFYFSSIFCFELAWTRSSRSIPADYEWFLSVQYKWYMRNILSWSSCCSRSMLNQSYAYIVLFFLAVVIYMYMACTIRIRISECWNVKLAPSILCNSLTEIYITCTSEVLSNYCISQYQMKKKYLYGASLSIGYDLIWPSVIYNRCTWTYLVKKEKKSFKLLHCIYIKYQRDLN